MTRPTVLVTDDDPLLLSLLEHKLSGAGYRVVTAMDGRMALQLIGHSPPDVIVLDVMMSSLDGFELLRRLKADAATRDVPVIMLTALRREQDVVGALKLGAADYLVRPFIPDELVARIARIAPIESAA